MGWLGKKRAEQRATYEHHLEALMREWAELGYNSDFSRTAIENFRSEGRSLDEMLASIYTAGFEPFCDLFSETAREKNCLHLWEGNERSLYDRAVKNSLVDTFGEEVAQATMERVGSSIHAERDSTSESNRAAMRTTKILLALHGFQLEAINNWWLAKETAKEATVTNMDLGSHEFTHWDELKLLVGLYEHLIEHEFDAFRNSLRSICGEEGLPVVPGVPDEERWYFEKSFEGALRDFRNGEFATDFQEALLEFRDKDTKPH